MKYNSQLELVSTGICRGEKEVATAELAKKEWCKYTTAGIQDGEKKTTSAEEIVKRLGVSSRPYASDRQNHVDMFYAAFRDALHRAEEKGHHVRGNIVALIAGSTTPEERMPRALEDICHLTETYHGLTRWLDTACSIFTNGVNAISAHAETNEGLEGYAVVGATEITRPLWKPDNFDLLMFGDIAGVALLKISHARNLPSQKRGIIGNVDEYVRDEKEIVWGQDGFIYMDGKAVMERAPKSMVETCRESLAQAGLSIQDIDKFVMHPGSAHVSHRTGKTLGRAYGVGFNAERQLLHSLDSSGNSGGSTTINILHEHTLNKNILPTDRVYVGTVGKGYNLGGFIIQPTSE